MLVLLLLFSDKSSYHFKKRRLTTNLHQLDIVKLSPTTTVVSSSNIGMISFQSHLLCMHASWFFINGHPLFKKRCPVVYEINISVGMLFLNLPKLIFQEGYKVVVFSFMNTIN